MRPRLTKLQLDRDLRFILMNMKAISFLKPLPITDADSLIDVEVDRPSPQPRDLLVEIRAISVNPVDTKIRGGGGPHKSNETNTILLRIA